MFQALRCLTKSTASKLGPQKLVTGSLSLIIALSPILLTPQPSRANSCSPNNYPSVRIEANGERVLREYRLIRAKRNQHGSVYTLGVPCSGGVLTIYRGKSGDAIIEYGDESDNTYRTNGSWDRSGSNYQIYYDNFTVYIPTSS